MAREYLLLLRVPMFKGKKDCEVFYLLFWGVSGSKEELGDEPEDEDEEDDDDE